MADFTRGLALVIFAFTYLLIGGRRRSWLPIGRTAGALVGAMLMIMARVITPDRAHSDEIVSFDTLGLLLGMMLISASLDEGGFFGWAAALVDRHVRRPGVLLVWTMLLSGGLSALLVNDTVCVMLTPLLLAVVQRRNLPLLPYVLALGFGANVGCALTLAGNPQNMLVGRFSGISYGHFAVQMALPVSAAMVVLVVLLRALFRTELARAATLPPSSEPHPASRAMVPGVAGFVVATVGFAVGFSMAGSALSGAVVCILLRRQDPQPVFARVDFPLLVFFAALFVVVGAMGEAGWVATAYAQVEPLLREPGSGSLWHLTWISVVGSQVFSNVPLVQALGPLVRQLPHAEPLFLVLALSSTLAGNLTPIGSVANVIVLEYTRKAGLEVGFRQFLRTGVPVTVLTTLAGVMVLWAQMAWLG